MIAFTRWLQFPFAVLLLCAFFQPWIGDSKEGVNALHLKERMEGPHQLLSLITRKGRLDRDYRLAEKTWILGAAEGVAMASVLWSPLTGWPGLITGAAASGAALWAKPEINSYPFQQSGHGVVLTLWSGLGLCAASALRLAASRRK